MRDDRVVLEERVLFDECNAIGIAACTRLLWKMTRGKAPTSKKSCERRWLSRASTWVSMLAA